MLTSVLFIFIPKDKNIWIFSSWDGKKASDNPAYFFNYCQSLGIKRLVWILKSKTEVKKLKLQGIEAYYTYSFHGFYFQLRASCCFFTHAIFSDFETCFIARNTKRCQMWHGIPMKKIGFDDRRVSFRMKFFQGTRWNKYLFNEFYTYVLSCGDLYTDIFSNAYQINDNLFVTTGFPRSEIFVNQSKLPTVNAKKQIIFAPTLRGVVGENIDIIELAGIDLDETDKMLKSINSELVIRLHPANKTELSFHNYSNIRLDVNVDGNASISNSDILITDFSSVMFDFYLTGKPILFFPYKYEQYISKDRELYFDYYTELPKGSTFHTWSEIIDALNSRNPTFEEIPLFERFYMGLDRTSLPSKSLYEFIEGKNVH